MDGYRFDTISKLFASRWTRRASLAQGATPAPLPEDPHPSADEPASPAYLFVQPFDAGTWAPKPGEDNTYTLTLSGVAAQTVYFSNRPERLVGLAPTQQFLDSLGFSPTNPPNAALVAQNDGGEQDVLVIELFNPVYAPDTSTLTYDAKVLADYAVGGLNHLARQQEDYVLSETFGDGGLFIDTCDDTSATCYQIINGEERTVGSIDSVGCCGNWDGCSPCNDENDSWYYGKLCAEAYPDQCFYTGDATGTSWNCFATAVGKCGAFHP